MSRTSAFRICSLVMVCVCIVMPPHFAFHKTKPTRFVSYICTLNRSYENFNGMPRQYLPEPAGGRHSETQGATGGTEVDGRQRRHERIPHWRSAASPFAKSGEAERHRYLRAESQAICCC